MSVLPSPRLQSPKHLHLHLSWGNSLMECTTKSGLFCRDKSKVSFLFLFEANQMWLNYEISLDSFEVQILFLPLQSTFLLNIDFDYYNSLQTQSRSTNCWRRWTKQPRSDMSIWRLLLGKWLINWLNSMKNVRFSLWSRVLCSFQ